VERKRIVVVGMGYAGIPVALSLAVTGKWDVTGIDVLKQKVESLNRGELPLRGKEPHLPQMLQKCLHDGTFRATTDFSPVEDAYAVLINVQTPVDEMGVPNYTHLKAAAEGVGRHLRSGTLVILESTVAPGTTEGVLKPILERASGLSCPKDFLLAYSYERVMVGRLVHNLKNYPRIVGGVNEESTERAVEIYRSIVSAEILTSDILTAEVAKTVENAYRDVNIAFANEVALLCESLGVDAYRVRELVNSLPYDPSQPHANPIRNMHIPGAGVGGHCLPKDSLLLIYSARSSGRFEVDAPLMSLSRRLNDYMPVHMFRLAKAALKRAGVEIAGARVTVLGYAFLQDSDDPRNSPAESFIKLMLFSGAGVKVHDPFVSEDSVPKGAIFTRDLEEALKGSDLAVIFTAHSVYRDIDPRQMKGLMRRAVVVDGRALFRGKESELEDAGVLYISLGRGDTLLDITP